MPNPTYELQQGPNTQNGPQETRDPLETPIG
jgi:hypothetical protein